MKHYRLYKVSSGTGKIVEAKDLQEPDDHSAMKHAEGDEDCPHCEIWQSTRKIGSIV